MTSTRFLLAATLGLAQLACSRSFAPPSTDVVPPRLSFGKTEGVGDAGTVLVPDGGVAVVRGTVRLRLLTAANSGPVDRVDFWTPGKRHEDADADLTWEVETDQIWPVGGVMTVYVTPYDGKHQPAPQLQTSFIVDNAPPQVVVTSPRPGTALNPGPVPLHFCAFDRPGVSGIALALHRIIDADGGLELFDDGGSDYGFEDAGRCFYSDKITAEPNGRSLMEIEIVATDDVGNSSHTRVEYPVSRVIDEGLLPGPALDVTAGGAPPVAFSAGFGLSLAPPDGSARTIENWIDADGIGSRVVGGAEHGLPIPGSARAFIEVDASQPTQPMLRRTTLRDDGGFTTVDAGSGPANWNASARALLRAAGARMSCLAPSSYPEPLDGGTLLCFLADGGTLEADLPVLGGGGVDTVQNLSVLHDQVVFRVSASARPDGGIPGAVLAHYDVTAGLQHLPDQPLPPQVLGSNDCLATYTGLTCFPTGPYPGAMIDGATGALSLYSGVDNALGVTPGGGLLAVVPRTTIGQQDLREVFADGRSNLLGCLGLDAPPTAITARFDAYHHLYVAYVDALHVNPVLLAFAPDAGLEWGYAGLPGQVVAPARPELIFDPLASPTDPASTLLLSLDDRYAYVLLSRLDPASGPRPACRP